MSLPDDHDICNYDTTSNNTHDTTACRGLLRGLPRTLAQLDRPEAVSETPSSVATLAHIMLPGDYYYDRYY